VKQTQSDDLVRIAKVLRQHAHAASRDVGHVVMAEASRHFSADELSALKSLILARGYDDLLRMHKSNLGGFLDEETTDPCTYAIVAICARCGADPSVR
jgi:hypothetical protein